MDGNQPRRVPRSIPQKWLFLSTNLKEAGVLSIPQTLEGVVSTCAVGEGQAHTFDYGMLSVKGIAAAIQG